MAKHHSYLLFLAWFAYLIVSSILLFINGFLLTRVTLQYNSTCVFSSKRACSPANEESLMVKASKNHEVQCSEMYPLSSIFDNISSVDNVCLPPRSRVVFIIIDALKYDFAVTNDSLEHPLPYQNKLPSINKLLKETPLQTRLYKFIADPPTTTMQRLKGLTTGSLPTFIDAGSNFATPEINEDNIIDQLVRHNKNVVFMGDNTWTGLYPNRFLRSFPFPSFNVWDLDTVDNGVITNLYPEMEKTDWHLLIAHFLGVDHCGHRYGPHHAEMSRKLSEMNTMIENVIRLMDNNTVLFVVGDHGMTVTGDHGGESVDEVTAALFMYSKKNLTSFVSGVEAVKQVDIVPTLSTLLGVPTPFSNLGAIILNALPLTEHSVPGVYEWKLALFSLWQNVRQIIDYIKVYRSKTAAFDSQTLSSHFTRYEQLIDEMSRVKSEQDFIEFAKKATYLIVDLRSMCEEVWVQFDAYSMTRGLLFLFLSLFFVYLIADGIPSSRLPEIFVSSFLACSYGAMLIAAFFSCLLYYLQFVNNLLHTIFFATCFVSQFMFAILIVQNWEIISLTWYDRSKKNRLVNFICRIVLVFNVFGLFSNSYIIEEAYVLLFCLVTVILVVTLEVGNHDVQQPAKTDKVQKWSKVKLSVIAFGIAALVRLSMLFWRCREEQQWCFKNPHEMSMAYKTQTTKIQWAITVVCLALFVTITKSWLKTCGNLNGFSLPVTFGKYVPTVVVVCSAGYWVLNRLPADYKNKSVKPWQANALAWVVYAVSSVGIISIIFKPLCIYFQSRESELSVATNANLIPQLFQHMKELFRDRRNLGNEVPVIYGLGTVYSSCFVIIGVYLTLVISLLLGDATALAAPITFLTAAFVLISTSIMRIERATKIEHLFEVPNILLLIWVIISQYFFYGSGHQPAFPNLPWEAAFVGVPGTFTSNFIPATLVIINTFSSFILMGFMLPLLLIAPFTVFLMVPSAVSRKSELFKDSTRGEVLLYERDKYMIPTVFSLCCKYILCHGLRVFVSMLSATIHCRHLMVWKIFAPKLIFECVGMLVTLATVICSFLILVRINYSVDKFIVSLNKQIR